jgi:Asp-tRNA(Asn)/Glu-tRNA(Gln) amidotransferase A subunit family amidase
MSESRSVARRQLASRLPGYTKNPYALDHVTAGSSGGTAAAVAANFGAVGLGSDTENSIRGSAAHTSLVGIRSTMGLTSRAGIVPLDLDRDIGGPMARSVADAVAVFDVIAGPDPDDPITLESKNRMPAQGYMSFLSKDGLRKARIGVLRSVMIRKERTPSSCDCLTGASRILRGKARRWSTRWRFPRWRETIEDRRRTGKESPWSGRVARGSS